MKNPIPFPVRYGACKSTEKNVNKYWGKNLVIKMAGNSLPGHGKVGRLCTVYCTLYTAQYSPHLLTNFWCF